MQVLLRYCNVPPSGGSLEIGNNQQHGQDDGEGGGRVPPSGGSLEIGNSEKHARFVLWYTWRVPPSGGSLEIGNTCRAVEQISCRSEVPPSGGSLEIGNRHTHLTSPSSTQDVPPSGGSLEIGNMITLVSRWSLQPTERSPFGGIPRNWKLIGDKEHPGIPPGVPPSGGSLEIGNSKTRTTRGFGS